MTPPLRWAGGKRWLVPRLRELYAPCRERRLVEPFGRYAAIPPQPDDFVYADPPYDVEFTRYSKDAFRWEDEVRLAEWLAAHPGPVVASNQATPRVLELYGGLGFAIETLPAPRRIACNGDRTPADEMLATRHMAR